MAEDTEDNIEEEVIEVSPLDLPDDELDAALEKAFTAPEEETETTETEEEEANDVEEEKETYEEETTEESEETTDNEEEASEEESKEELDKSTKIVDDEKNKEDKDSKDEEETTEDTQETPEIDYKAEYEKLLGTFRANGKDMQVDNVDDAVTLMKMGANYNKKMAGLKPNLKLVKMLENNNLLDEAKLSYLIDLDKKDPAAINKLIKDSGIDPLEIDEDKTQEYKSNTYTVDDKEVELDEVLDSIKDTSSFKDTVDIISNKWDTASKQVLLENPKVIGLINEHVESGIYDKITTIMDKERMLGRLKGLSDLEAYKQVGNEINAQGGFKPTEENIEKAPVKKPKTKASDPKLRNKKKAASSTRSTAGTKGKKNFNPLALSDEDFKKVSSSKYL